MRRDGAKEKKFEKCLHLGQKGDTITVRMGRPGEDRTVRCRRQRKYRQTVYNSRMDSALRLLYAVCTEGGE